MENCPICKSPTNKYPGGTSKKTNKPYNARTSCDNPECSWVVWENDDKKAPQRGSQVSNNTFQDEIMSRLADRLDSIDEKLDSIIKYFINEKKEAIREKSWKLPNPSSPESETQSEKEE